MFFRGQKSPILLKFLTVISVAKIENILNNLKKEFDFFIVEIKIKTGNKIFIAIDNFKNISIDDCSIISERLHEHLSYEEEDFELEVSSPGLTQPFKVMEQYIKNKDKEVEIVLKSGEKITGKLAEINDEDIIIEMIEKIKEKNKKKEITQVKRIGFSNIKTTRKVIKFNS